MARTGYAIFDTHGQLVGTHVWGHDTSPTHCPLSAPPGGAVVELNSVADAEAIQAEHISGQTRTRLHQGAVLRDDQPLQIKGVHRE
jgi:hypothetical protein